MIADRPVASGADARGSGASRRRAQRARARGAREARAPRRRLASIPSSSRSWAPYQTRNFGSASASTRTLSITSHEIDSGDYTSVSSGAYSLIEVNGQTRCSFHPRPLNRNLQILGLLNIIASSADSSSPVFRQKNIIQPHIFNFFIVTPTILVLLVSTKCYWLTMT